MPKLVRINKRNLHFWCFAPFSLINNEDEIGAAIYKRITLKQKMKAQGSIERTLANAMTKCWKLWNMIDKDKRPLQEFSCKLKKCWNSVQALTQKSEKTQSFCSLKNFILNNFPKWYYIWVAIGILRLTNQ